jgi:O-antigen/teichoic acid export membrane protein
VLSRLRQLLTNEIGSLLAGSAWIYALRVGGAALTFITHYILAHTIGPDELGQYVLAFSTAMMVGFGCTLALPATAMRFLPVDIESGRTGHARGFLAYSQRMVLAASLVVWLIFTVVTLVLFHDASASVLWTHLLGAAMIPICAALISLTDIGRALSLMTSTFAPSFIVRQLGLFLFVLLFLALGVALNAAWVTGITLVSMVPLVYWQYRITRRHAEATLGPGPKDVEAGHWIMSALPLVFVFGFTGFFLELNITLAGQVLPSGELAAYNLAFQLVNLAGFALTAIDYKISPELAAHLGAGRMEDFNRLLRWGTTLRTAAGLSIVVGLAVVGPFILSLFGTQFEIALTALLILALTQVMAGLIGPVGTLQMFLGLERQGLIISIVSVIAAVSLTPVFVIEWGLEGAALSALLSIGIWEVGLLWVIWRKSGIQPTILSWVFPSAKQLLMPLSDELKGELS